MKTAVCILAAWSLAVAADNEPNFTGEWKMNPGKSALGPIPVPISLNERSSRMTSWQNAGFGPGFLIFVPKA
jgi:hypothetical protein